jgi:AAA domain, putative AbiEii toxin, Type IV TA system
LKRLANTSAVAARLSELIPGVLSIDVDQDNIRETLTVVVTMKDKERFSASSLSDGTLRFLALAVLASDPDASGLVCMEEPENGIHPLRIPEMLNLVRCLADADVSEHSELAEGSAIRQVIINTHSPQVVAELPADELLMAQALRLRGSEFVEFKPMSGTWRAKSAHLQPNEIITPGDLSSYLQRALPAKRLSGQPRVGDVVTAIQEEFRFLRS